MQFDIDMSRGKDKAASDSYLTMLAENYFNVARDKTVLEIAAHAGAHTSALLVNDPKKIICVEPDPVSCNYSIFTNPKVEFHSCTANDYYKHHSEKVDVVTCFGLFYHLHSPFHLVEQIVNYSDPTHIIIETLWQGDTTITNENNSYKELLVINHEEPNAAGNFFKDAGVTRPVKLNIEIDYKYIRQAFIDAGYRVINETVYHGKYNLDSKQGAAVTLFEKL